MSVEKEGHYARYLAACHAVQSGVKFDLELGSDSASGKHLRTGINVALRDSASLARLLMDKGVITEEEYLKAIADGMEEEKCNYEIDLSLKLGRKITLG